MNYHIIPQDKFFDSYIEDIYKLHQENNNIFWIRGNEGESEFFKSRRDVTFIGYDKYDLIEKLKKINVEDKLIISWFDSFVGSCIIESGIKNKVYSYLMGGDFYNEPIGYHDFWLYDSKTKKIVNRFHKPQLNLHIRPKNWYKISIEIKNKLHYKKKIASEYNTKNNTLSRIDYIITAPYNDYEIQFIKQLYPSFGAEYLYGTFNQNYDLSLSYATNMIYDGTHPIKILLGNSADPCNNHIDACLYLHKKINIEYEVYCPLSYGDSSYSSIFQKWAILKIKDKFHPILNFLNRGEYIEMINNMDIMVMYHNRQQAFGNIITAICLGKPVFLKEKSPLFQLLKKIGITSVYDVATINTDNIIQICRDASENRLLSIELLKDYFSEESRLKYLKAILEK